METDDRGQDLKFLLQGTNPTIFPWIPPENLPLSVLQKMRIRLLTVFYESIITYVQSVPSHQTSPAGSVYDFPKILLDPTDLDGFE